QGQPARLTSTRRAQLAPAGTGNAIERAPAGFDTLREYTSRESGGIAVGRFLSISSGRTRTTGNRDAGGTAVALQIGPRHSLNDHRIASIDVRIIAPILISCIPMSAPASRRF